MLGEESAVGRGGTVVEHAEREGALDHESGHCFHHAARTATVFGKFTNLSDVTAVADFEHVPRDDKALALSVVGVEVDVVLGFGFGSEATMNGTCGAISDTLVLIRGSILEPDEVLSRTIEASTVGGDVGGGIDAVNNRISASSRVRSTRSTSTAIDDGVRVDASVEELGWDKSQLTEVALEVVNRRLDGVGGGISVVLDAGGQRRLSLGVDEVRELTLQSGTDDGFVVLELASLLIDRGHDILNRVLTQLVNRFTSASDRRGRGAEVFTDGADGLVLGAVLLLSVVSSGEGGVLNPSRQTASAIRGRTVVDGRKDVRGEREFHRTLKVDGSLGQLTRQFILNASDVENILRQVGHVNGTAEHVDVIFHFFTVAEGVLLEGRVLRRVAWVNVSTVENTEFNRGVWVAVNLPAERSISGFGATFSHGRDWGVLGIDVSDEVRQFFTDTDTTRGKAIAGRAVRKRTLIVEL